MRLVEKPTPSDLPVFRNPHPKKDKIREFVAVLVIDLVEKVEKYPEEFEGLQIAHIPEEATDYTIIEFDGFEVVYYVVDGKIYRTIK